MRRNSYLALFGAIYILALMECTSASEIFGTANNEKINTTNETLYWGSYRPNLYFGMKTRDLHPFQTGIMWSTVKQIPKEKSSDVMEIMNALREHDGGNLS